MVSKLDYQKHAKAIEDICDNGEGSSGQLISSKVNFFLRAYRAAQGRELESNSMVPDFGCGIGNVVACLEERGMDTCGIDILEYWGKDFQLWGRKEMPPDEKVISKLYTYAEDNKLPFSANTFDLIISDQVIEHVSEIYEVFSEQVSVLRREASLYTGFLRSTP